MLSQHLLKIACQPERHARSWNLPVRTQHQEVREILRDSPSLAARPDSLVSDAYNAAETERALGTAPAACPWPADEARAFVPPEPPPRRPQPRFAR